MTDDLTPAERLLRAVQRTAEKRAFDRASFFVVLSAAAKGLEQKGMPALSQEHVQLLADELFESGAFATSRDLYELADKWANNHMLPESDLVALFDALPVESGDEDLDDVDETCEDCANSERCCYSHGHHVEPHRGCILR